MRLTLRTLLCYLDDILDPTDSRDLGKKIEESKFASDLVQRIRSVSRQPQMGAPRLDGKGLGLDANTVSEYLDNTLPAELVPEYERICLESDMHMAETSASHQVLTLVLGEPVEVAPELRQRMYAIGQMSEAERQSRAENAVIDQGTSAVPAPMSLQMQAAATATASPIASGSEAEAHATVGPAARKPRPKPEVPDYMKAGRRHNPWPVFVAVAASFLVAAVALRGMGPFDSSHPLYRLIAGPPPAEVASLPAREEGEQADTLLLQPGESAAETVEGYVPNTVGSPPAKAPIRPALDDLAPLPDDAPNQGSSIPSATDPVSNAFGPGNEPVRPLPPAKERAPAGDLAPFPDDEPAPVPKLPPGTTVPPAKAALPAAGPAPLVPGSQVARVEPPAAGTIPGPAEGPEATAPPRSIENGEVRVASFISGDEILARLTPENGEWQRLAPRSALSAGQRLLALPAFRPKALLVTGIQLELDGGSAVRLVAPAPDGAPGLVLEQGRALLWTVERVGTAVDIQLGQAEPARVGRLTFTNADAVVAIVVNSYLPPGANPETDFSLPVAQIYVTAGQAVWSEAASKPLPLAPGRVLNLLGDQPPAVVAATTLPDWIAGKHLSDIELRAARTLAAEISTTRALGLSLNEMAEDRRSEVKSLAVRSLGSLDQFEPFVGVLADEFQKSSWASHFDSLREAVSRGPTTAARVRAAFERLRHEDGKLMYRLLWSYSPEQLRGAAPQQGLATDLVSYLEHPLLEVRVLAFENLRRITGTTHLYRPESPEIRRRSSMVAWRERLKSGQVAYKTPPSPLPEVPATGFNGGNTGAAPGETVAPAPFSPPATATPAVAPIPAEPAPIPPPALLPALPLQGAANGGFSGGAANP